MSPYLASSVSLQMVPEGASLDIRRLQAAPCLAEYQGEAVSRRTASGWDNSRMMADYYTLAVTARVGHEGTVAAINLLLSRCGLAIQVDRTPIHLEPGDTLYVAQPVGQRLAPGQELEAPDLAWYEVRVQAPGLMDRLRVEHLARVEAEERADRAPTQERVDKLQSALYRLLAGLRPADAAARYIAGQIGLADCEIARHCLPPSASR